MQKRVITNLLILVMALLTGMSSQVPVVLCFGEDGHIQIELVEFSHHHSPSHHSPATAKDLACDHNGCNDCGDCTDIAIVSQEFIQNTGLRTKSLVNASFVFIYQAPETTNTFNPTPHQRINIKLSPPPDPTVNRLLDKMSFII